MEVRAWRVATKARGEAKGGLPTVLGAGAKPPLRAAYSPMRSNRVPPCAWGVAGSVGVRRCATDSGVQTTDRYQQCVRMASGSASVSFGT